MCEGQLIDSREQGEFSLVECTECGEKTARLVPELTTRMWLSVFIPPPVIWVLSYFCDSCLEGFVLEVLAEDPRWPVDIRI